MIPNRVLESLGIDPATFERNLAAAAHDVEVIEAPRAIDGCDWSPLCWMPVTHIDIDGHYCTVHHEMREPRL